MTERDFQRTVIDLAELHGWLVYHTFDSRHSQKGFPDLVLCRPPRVIFAELKTEKGKLSAHQKTWIQNIQQCRNLAANAYVWRPSDWNRITEELR